MICVKEQIFSVYYSALTIREPSEPALINPAHELPESAIHVIAAAKHVQKRQRERYHDKEEAGEHGSVPFVPLLQLLSNQLRVGHIFFIQNVRKSRMS